MSFTVELIAFTLKLIDFLTIDFYTRRGKVKIVTKMCKMYKRCQEAPFWVIIYKFFYKIN